MPGHAALVRVETPVIAAAAADQLVVEGLEVAAEESADQTDVEQENRQPNTGNPHGEKFAKTGLRTLIRITWKRVLLEFSVCLIRSNINIFHLNKVDLTLRSVPYVKRGLLIIFDLNIFE